MLFRSLLTQTFKQPATHVPYKGHAAYMADLISGRIDITYNFVPALKNSIDNGQLVPLAISGPERLPEYPNVPTLNELGMGQYNIPAWIALFANTTADKETIKAVQNALKDVASDPKKRLEFKKQTGGLTIDKRKLFSTEEFLFGSIKINRKIINDNKIILE